MKQEMNNESLTPERDALWAKHDGLTSFLAADMLALAGSLELRLTVAMTALRYCHDYAKPDLIIRGDVTGPAFAEIQRIKDGCPVLTSAPPVP